MSTASPSKIAARFLRAFRGFDMDIVARASVLEAAAGLPKGTFSDKNNWRTFLKEGPVMFPDAHGGWFSRSDIGFGEAIIQGTKEILKHEGGEATAEEVAQNMMGGLSIGGGNKETVFTYTGKHHAQSILEMGASPQKIRTRMYIYAKARALDVIRKKNRRPSLVNDEALQGVNTSDIVDSSPNEVMLSLISGPAGRQFRNWIDRTIRRKATDVQVIIYDASTDHMVRTGEWPSARQIRDKVIETKGSGISERKINEHRAKIQTLIAREMKGNPKVLDWADRYLDLAELGYGGGQLRAAKMASRVAARFLQGYGTKTFKVPNIDPHDDRKIIQWVERNVRLPYRGRMTGKVLLTDIQTLKDDAESSAELLRSKNTRFPDGLASVIAVLEFDLYDASERGIDNWVTPYIGVVQTGYSST